MKNLIMLFAAIFAITIFASCTSTIAEEENKDENKSSVTRQKIKRPENLKTQYDVQKFNIIKLKRN